MQVGFGILRLPPAHFWAMTPREIAAAMDAIFGPGHGALPGRSDLAALMARYPDRDKDLDHA